jgi:hypothetical protein
MVSRAAPRHLPFESRDPTEPSRLTSVAYEIAAGPDGALWFTETFASRIGRITTSGVVSEFPLPTSGSGPADIAAGPDGALWFTEEGVHKIGRITTSGAITEYPISALSAVGVPSGIAAGSDAQCGLPLTPVSRGSRPPVRSLDISSPFHWSAVGHRGRAGRRIVVHRGIWRRFYR